MTEEQIKEALSNNYIAVLANRNGFKLEKNFIDTGVDFTVRYDVRRQMPNGTFVESQSPLSCDLQLKATTTDSIEVKNGKIIYDLRIKNYNDLINRKIQGHTPLVLILFILPNNEDEWAMVFRNRLILSKNAFWYYPGEKENQEVINDQKKRIKIPVRNRLDFDFFERTIKTWIPEWKSTI